MVERCLAGLGINDGAKEIMFHGSVQEQVRFTSMTDTSFPTFLKGNTKDTTSSDGFDLISISLLPNLSSAKAIKDIKNKSEIRMK